MYCRTLVQLLCVLQSISDDAPAPASQSEQASAAARSKWEPAQEKLSVAVERSRWEVGVSVDDVNVAIERSRWEDAAVAATLSHLPLEATASEMGGTQVVAEEAEDGAERPSPATAGCSSPSTLSYSSGRPT